ncbi:hypothetical protein BDV95DRAFT_374985 [Massariosphaeria phaeospora]|uniref:Uncharacterized protein n=1 Tax=Massariosphaeria phaeospora TaxID=100035 RepID=A0A7C8M7X7_9PLEO|nr:hypothetical protein BDV95DRAFT_374985 [Massariosphaeria phaeospora]
MSYILSVCFASIRPANFTPVCRPVTCEKLGCRRICGQTQLLNKQHTHTHTPAIPRVRRRDACNRTSKR